MEEGLRGHNWKTCIEQKSKSPPHMFTEPFAGVLTKSAVLVAENFSFRQPIVTVHLLCAYIPVLHEAFLWKREA